MKKTADKPTKYTLPEDQFKKLQGIHGQLVALSDITEEVEKYDPIELLLRPIYNGLDDVMGAFEQENGGEESAHPEADKPTSHTIPQEVQVAVGKLDELGYAIEEIQAVYAELRKNTGLKQLPVSQQVEEGGAE